MPPKETDRRSARDKNAAAKRLAKNPRENPSPSMSYFEDRGTVLDAPLEVVWDFMQRDEEFHPKAHAPTLRKLKAKVLSEVTSLIRYERQTSGGRWTKFASRLTEIRPAVRIKEDLEGPYAGSVTVHIYRPRGRKTSVDILCYMRSSEFSPEDTKREWLRIFARAGAEDAPWLRRFARKHAAGPGPRS
jgi:hypothetical protein